MNNFNVYKVSAKNPAADRPHVSMDFLDDDAAGALEQAKAAIPHAPGTQFLVALSHE